MYAKAKAAEATQVIARKIGDELRAGRTADEAIQRVIAAYVRESKVATLKVLPLPPASTSADSGGAPGSARDAAVADKLLSTSLPDKRFDASTDADRPQVQTSSAFNRGGDPFPGLSPEGTAGVVSFAFSGKDGEVMSDPVQAADGLAVVQLKQRKIATRDEFQKDRETFEDELLRVKRDEALSLYVKRMREQAKGDIQIEAAYVEEARADGGTGSVTADEDEY
jgi:hypothetical protein